MRRLTVALAVSAAAAAGVASPAGSATAAGAARAPLIEQLVVFKSGESRSTRARPRGTRVRVGGRRCRVAAGTPLAVLARSGLPRLRLRDDFGSCPASAAGVYVKGIGPDVERLGEGSGWVYKVGRRAASAGSGDPTGPFGRGRLRRGQRVLWFFCVKAGDCQRTLEVKASARPGGEVEVRVIGYDDNGRGLAIEGATVDLGPVELTTDAQGTARATLAPGRYGVTARKAGLVRSFRERVRVE